MFLKSLQNYQLIILLVAWLLTRCYRLILRKESSGSTFLSNTYDIILFVECCEFMLYKSVLDHVLLLLDKKKGSNFLNSIKLEGFIIASRISWWINWHLHTSTSFCCFVFNMQTNKQQQITRQMWPHVADFRVSFNQIVLFLVLTRFSCYNFATLFISKLLVNF